MNVVFYNELAAPPGANVRQIFSGEVACAGSLGRIWMITRIARILPGARVSLFHRISAGAAHEMVDGVRCVRVDSDDKLVAELGMLTRNDILVVGFYRELPELIDRLRHVPCYKVVCANCNPPFEWCDKIDGKTLHRLVCVSKRSMEYYRLHKNFNRVAYIYGSFNTSSSIPRPRLPRANTVAFIGALREEKGFHHLLHAWPLVRAAVPEATLAVFGSIRLHLPDSPVGITNVLTPDFERKYLVPILPASGDWRELGINFTFPQSKASMLDQLTSTWVGVVNPNVYKSVETFCLSAVEMQACGCPCIGGGAGGLLETISDGVSGFHLHSEQRSELAGRIIQILRDKRLRDELSAGAVIYSAQFASTEREARDWVTLFGQISSGISSFREPSLLGDWGRKLQLGRLKARLKRIRSRLDSNF